ncbi:protein MAIN-LIKE 2-like [Arachis ipaensis]|uniref:protein MAIN-LIKE 2-like n=1 Tax=Arachis ipaensis TaxID=130454 RepID=UPI0007AF90C3|nr:protein MAIN-LIKE 2-like [Arachis ipaensis]XP_025652917.1 protein MAIN-LIKE 2-like [Arachis hypogaea]
MLGLPPPPILLSYIREAGFGHAVELKDFLFDRCLIYAIVEQWRPETYTFHLLWGEASITLEDVAYHTGLRTAGEPVGGCTRDFQRWHGHPTWEWAEDLLGARPPPPQQEGRQVFAVRMTWLRNQVAHIPDGASPETLRQYARCYLMMLIGGVFIHGQVGNTCAVEMASTTRGFRSMQPVVMGVRTSLDRDRHCRLHASSFIMDIPQVSVL